MACNNLLSVLILACFVIDCYGSYVITTPRTWLPEGKLKVCIQVMNPQAPAGHVDVSIFYTEKPLPPPVPILPVILNDSRSRGQFIPTEAPIPFFEMPVITVNVLEPTTIKVSSGNQHICEDLSLPAVSKFWQNYQISVTGQLDGMAVNHTGVFGPQNNIVQTIVQTDKYLYKPGQKVQLRILSHSGPLMNISTEPYAEIFINTPSRNRIAQWLNVDNSKGLVHLEMQLADEPEEGVYSININDKGNQFRAQTNFKVEEYVLPRFEVTVKPPAYVFRRDDSVTFSACGKYTFGEPVNGNISWTIFNLKNRDCRVEITKNETISGCSEFTIRSTDLRMMDCSVNSIRATAIITEEGTGAEGKGQELAPLYSNAFIIQTLSKDDYMKPNIPYTLKVLAKLPDESPAAGELLEVCHGSSCNNMTTPSDGIIRIYLANRRSKSIQIQGLVTRAGMSLTKYHTNVKQFYSPSNSSLLISVPEESLECVGGQDTLYTLPVLFASASQESAVVNVQVMSRGQIQYFKSEEYSFSSSPFPIEEEFLLDPLVPTSSDIVTGVLSIPLSLPPTASPTAKVLVWYIRDDGEVVSDTKTLKIETCLPNNVNLSWSTNRTQPGQLASWKIESAPNSICSLGVLDKSVELLSSHKDISVDTFFRQNFDQSFISSQVNDREYCRRSLQIDLEERNFDYFSNYVDTFHMFDQSGLYVFSDLTLETRPCLKQEIINRFGGGAGFGGGGGGGFINTRLGGLPPTRIGSAPAFDSNAGFRGTSGQALEGSSPDELNAPRTDFPETWLWDLIIVPDSGSVEEDLYVPDTITEWVGNAVCVHPDEGVGVSGKTSITTFTPFFIDLTLPPSIKRGEILSVKISVFNYLQQSLPIRVTLESSPEYDIIEEASADQSTGQRLSCVGSQEKQVHTVKIQPSVIGEVNITVSAYVDNQSDLSCGSVSNVDKRDALIKPITVEAEGFLRETSWSKYICADEVANGQDRLDVTEVIVPAGMVEGSERAWITAVGDLLAISLQNLGSLIRMPYGCGEQNMLNFAPNIYILQYLKATQQETPEATQKLLKFMRTGYQRQLLYRHNNGAYSAFGNADPSGSTWLSAFVLKSFSQAQQFITIGNETIQSTRTWLLNNYGNNMCAETVGKVFHKGMKGGLGGKLPSQVPLTAYVLISLLESGANKSHSTIKRGLGCIMSSRRFSDSYTEALITYALVLAEAPNAEEKINSLLQQAVISSNSTYWELPEGSGNSKALQVETASYAILAMMAYDSALYKLQARKVVKWISSQRNGRGGFYSTQDTVVALQALASFESSHYQGDLDVVAKVIGQDFHHAFNVNKDNSLVQQQVSVPVLPTNVSFNMVGQGCAVLQTVLRYNDPNPDASDVFSLRVNTETAPDQFCITKRISACASYLLPDGPSNMAVIEVNLVSGYIPEKDDLKRMLDFKGIKRYEVDGNKVTFYIDEFVFGSDMCVNFRVIRQADVDNAKPGSVVVYDYYQPEYSVSETYNLPLPSQCRYD